MCGKRLTVEKKQPDKNKKTFKAGEIESKKRKRKYKREMMCGHLMSLGVCHSVLIWLQVTQRTTNNARRTLRVISNCQALKEVKLHKVDQCRKKNNTRFFSFVTGWMIR